MDEHKALYPPLTAATGARGLCPRCGKGRLFRGFLKVAPQCDACGLDFAFADSGDGPAIFIMTIVGFVVVALALFVEFAYSPPYWLHALLWVPLILGLSLALLPPMKGWLIAQQYLQRAAEGRIDGT